MKEARPHAAAGRDACGKGKVYGGHTHGPRASASCVNRRGHRSRPAAMAVDETAMTPAARHSATRVEWRAARQRPPPSLVATMVDSASAAARDVPAHQRRRGMHASLLPPAWRGMGRQTQQPVFGDRCGDNASVTAKSICPSCARHETPWAAAALVTPASHAPHSPCGNSRYVRVVRL